MMSHEVHAPSICTRANTLGSIVPNAGMAEMMPDTVMRGLASKSKPLMGRKSRRGGSVLGIRVEDDVQEGDGW